MEAVIKQFLFFGQTYAEWIIMGMLFLQYIAIFVAVHKITVIRKQLNKIKDQVEEYIETVIQTEEENVRETEERRRASEKEAQSQLISSVLEEIFP